MSERPQVRDDSVPALRRGEFVAFGQVVVAALGKPPLPGSEREHTLVGEVL